MIKKFAQFWIENTKVTIVLILVTIFAGIGSYIILPKQYNPDIPVPAFNITVPAPGFSTQEVENLVIQPLEDKLNEIKDIDHIYGFAGKDFGLVMVQFKVGTDKEKATTRLYNKIFENLGNKPIGVKEPIIKKMDSDDFPIYTFAIYNSNKQENTGENLIKLRKIGFDVANQLKFVPGTSVFYLVGGYKNQLNIILDLDKLKGKNIDIMQVYQAIKNNNINFPAGELKLNSVQSSISINGSLADIDKLKKLVIGMYNNKPVYLQEVAHIFKGINEINNYSFVRVKNQNYDSIFVGVAKQKGVNAVALTKKIKEKLEEIQKTLPEGYKILKVANEGKVAEDSTNSLLINLAQSVFIVFLVLLFYLGKKDAINNSFAIPLTLLMVFLIALILQDNINRIVLFALVLALGMLVDNSTVVIENMSRHLKERKEGTTVKQAILNAVDEVGVGVVLATITRILALVAMFFVTGMMGEYMGGVPKYVIISLLVSLLIAFSINPFLAYIFNKNSKIQTEKENKKSNKEGKLDIIYAKFIGFFLGNKNKLRRTFFKLTFWGTLIAVLVYFPYKGVFKMAMLPKDNKNQIYLWVDGPRNWTVEKSKQAVDDLNKLLDKYTAVKTGNIQDDKIIKNISYNVGIAPIIDFSNAFRGISNRQMPYQISARINLIDKDKREVSSIQWIEKIRYEVEKEFWKKYPNAKLRFLEDPPGPPVRATFMLKIQGERDASYSELESLATYVKDKLKPLLLKDKIVDLYTTVDTYKTNYIINIDHQLLSSYGLDVQQVAYTMYNIFNGANVSLLHSNQNKEAENIFLSIKNNQKYNPKIFDEISFMNKQGQKIYLKQFASIQKDKLPHMIITEDKYKSVYIYGEIGENSIFYPALHTSLALIKDKFYNNDFKVIGKNPYTITIQSLKTGKKYYISWGGERKVSLDTFRDLGIAMMMALLAIYFLMVAQFKSFKIAGVIMLTFVIGLFGIMPGFSLSYLWQGAFFTAPSMIGVIALAGIVVGNAIIFIEYLNLLLKKGYTRTLALIKTGQVRKNAIIITSLTTVLGSTTILSDPVWGGLGWSIVWGLTASAILTLIVLPIFLYDLLEDEDSKHRHIIDEAVQMDVKE